MRSPRRPRPPAPVVLLRSPTPIVMPPCALAGRPPRALAVIDARLHPSNGRITAPAVLAHISRAATPDPLAQRRERRRPAQVHVPSAMAGLCVALRRPCSSIRRCVRSSELGCCLRSPARCCVRSPIRCRAHSVLAVAWSSHAFSPVLLRVLLVSALAGRAGW